jgi:hypothetical protein
MSDKLSKITQLISVLLFVLSILFGSFFYYNVMSMEAMPEGIVLPADKVAWTMENLGFALENFVYVVYALVILALLSTLGFSIMNVFSSVKTAKKSLLYLGVMGGVLLLSYLLASPEIPIFFGYEKFNITPGMAMSVDTGLISMYLFFLLAVGGVVFTGVKSLLR